MSIEQGKKLATAIRSNNNDNTTNTKNSTIDQFIVSELQLQSRVFQPILDALLDSCVQRVALQIRHQNNINNNDDTTNNINFTGFSTNTSITELIFYGGQMLPQDRMNLHEALTINNTVKILRINYHSEHVLDENEKKSFLGMLRGNISLNNVTLTSVDDHGNQQVPDVAAYDDLKKEIVMHTALNRKYV